MKPYSRAVLPSISYLQTITVGPIVANIKGSVKKLGSNCSQALVVLYNKDNLLPIATRKPNTAGNYQFLGLNTDLKTFIIAFDQKQQFNAVLQDNVVPK